MIIGASSEFDLLSKAGTVIALKIVTNTTHLLYWLREIMLWAYFDFFGGSSIKKIDNQPTMECKTPFIKSFWGPCKGFESTALALVKRFLAIT